MELSSKREKQSKGCEPQELEIDGVCVDAYKDYSAGEKFARRTVRGLFNLSNLRKVSIAGRHCHSLAYLDQVSNTAFETGTYAV